MSRGSRFQRANELAREKVEEISGKCLVIFQIGSSLRKADFSPYSDVDLLAVYKKEPEEGWTSDYNEEVQVSIIQESEKNFLENLNKGRGFELTALKYGKVLKGNDYVKRLEEKDYRPKRLTFETWLQSALNHYGIMLSDRNMPVEFYNSAYHSFRGFSEYLILHHYEKFVEDNSEIKENLEGISPKLATNFWNLRNKRFEPPSLPEGFIEIDELENNLLYKEVEKVESIGERVFQIEELEFPSFKRVKREVEKKGYRLTGSLMATIHKKKATLSGEDKESGELEILIFDMETGKLEEMERRGKRKGK